MLLICPTPNTKLALLTLQAMKHLLVFLNDFLAILLPLSLFWHQFFNQWLVHSCAAWSHWCIVPPSWCLASLAFLLGRLLMLLIWGWPTTSLFVVEYSWHLLKQYTILSFDFSVFHYRKLNSQIIKSKYLLRALSFWGLSSNEDTSLEGLSRNHGE